MAVKFNFKKHYDVNDLIEIVRILREPDGCPWDREQTHSSIKKNFIEETYEVIEAINKQDSNLLCEELGDVLLQVALHSQMESEKGNFDFSDAVDGICQKLIIRHPHVFGSESANSADEALLSWDAVKKKTKGQKNQTESMQSVPRELPALMRAQKVQQKAAKSGFDWKDAGGAFDKLAEEINELKIALSENNRQQIEEEFGDLLFSAVNVGRFVNCDCEEALTSATDKFIARFKLVEKMAEEIGVEMNSLPLSVLDSYWNEAKVLLSK